MNTKTDARKLDQATQAHLRKMVVQAVRGGMTRAEAARTYGVSLRAVGNWMKLAREGGLRALRAGKRGRRQGSGHLTHPQAVRMRKLIIERMPDQLALPFYLWTRESVAQLIERECAVKVSKWTAGRYLKAWGMSAQKPVRRAYERKDEEIERWLNEDYPGIAKEAKQEGATIYWGDEMGLRSDHVSGTSFALKGETPVVRATGKRFGCNMISAITNRGELSFMVFEGTFKNATFIDFMKRLLRQATRKIYLIVDGHPVHRSKAVKRFVADNAERLRLIRLPGYCPELNPDELLNQDVKTNALGKSRPATKAEMIGTVRRHLHRRQKEPHVIRNLFKERHVRYAA
ncbi:helix-turn-helix, type 11 domain-containing protein [Caballeronia calidae]|uniref:Helix-turn-helix, type 11 domain-containing protein n=1 Tax=Caballeronia calidae TaxID=1777139 RepID=A0A158EMT3_9BURK|nr:IS630 family transposase [Caballeronia calidae]SAL07696.1 helix-turn-helix, type 11 domain-containing protein [Caballeronia calidae]